MPEKKTLPLLVELKNGKIYEIVEVKGFTADNSIVIEAQGTETEPQPISEVALALADVYMDAYAKNAKLDDTPVVNALGKPYQKDMTQWFNDFGFLTFGYHLDVEEPFNTDYRIQFIAQEYTVKSEKESEQKVSEKIVYVKEDKVIEPEVNGQLTSEQAKSFNSKTLPPYLKNTDVINDIAFTDAYVLPITKIEFLTEFGENIEVKLSEKDLAGKNTHTPAFLNEIRDALFAVALKYEELFPKFDYSKSSVTHKIDASNGVYSITIK